MRKKSQRLSNFVSTESEIPTILICDARPLPRTLMQDVLQTQGYVTLIISSRKTAVDALMNTKANLAILHISLIGIPGYEKLIHLQKNRQLSVPIIIIGPWVTHHSIPFVDAYFQDPVSVHTIGSAVQNILSNNKRLSSLILTDCPKS